MSEMNADEDGVLGDEELQEVGAEPTTEEFIEWVEATVSGIESFNPNANMHWCPQWWQHPEAVGRLQALHRQRLACAPTEEEPYGTDSTWWVDHWDRHAAVLFAKDGPFGECRGGHTDKQRLSIAPVPEGWEP